MAESRFAWARAVPLASPGPPGPISMAKTAGGFGHATELLYDREVVRDEGHRVQI